MILTYVTYGLLIILFGYGFKFAGFRNFNDDYLDKDYTKCLSGLAAILVILHHISQRPAFQDATGELFFFNDIGFLITSVFLFASGYGLTVSANKNPEYINNFKRRVLTVLIPYVICNVVFSIERYLTGEPLAKCLVGLTGLIAINPNGWFPVTLLVMYFAFWLNRKFVKNKGLQIVVYLLFIAAMISIFCVSGHYAWWSGENGNWLDPNSLYDKKWWQGMQVFLFSGEWWVNSAIAFVVGVIFGDYKEKLFNFFKKGYWLKLFVSILLFVGSYEIFKQIRDARGYWSEYGVFGPGINDKFITAAAQFLVPAFFVLMIAIFMMKFTSKNPILNFLGKVSYETYLYGVLALDGLNFVILENDNPIVNQPYNYNLAIYAIGVIALSILLGFVMNKLDAILIKKINK